MKTLALLLLAMLLSIKASAQLMTTGIGPGAAGSGPPPVNCGTGVLDLSTGCVLPLIGYF